MKKDAEVQLLLHERHKGRTQVQAAARAGMSERTVRKYERAGALPSQLKQPRTHRTRPDPFTQDWAWVERQLDHDPALQANTLFALLCAQHPGRYQAGQVRTLQRHIRQYNWWRSGGLTPAGVNNVVTIGEYRFSGRWQGGTLQVWRGGPGNTWSYINLEAPSASLTRAIKVFDAINNWNIEATGSEWIET